MKYKYTKYVPNLLDELDMDELMSKLSDLLMSSGFGNPRDTDDDSDRTMQALHDAMLARGLESPYAERLEEWKPDPEHAARITTRVPCAEYFPVRDEALIAHATQIDPGGHWFACPLEVHQEAWPTEDYELARSLVEVDLPESDLFAGVRELAATARPAGRRRRSPGAPW